MQMQFEWDSDKAAANVSRHGVSFELAMLVFLDNGRLIKLDERFDYGEERIITMGHVNNRLHVVVYTQTNDTVRIISARKANRRERKRYAND